MPGMRLARLPGMPGKLTKGGAAMMADDLKSSYLFGGNAPYIEQLYEDFLQNPNSVEPHWRDYFEKVGALPGAAAKDQPRLPVERAFAKLARRPPMMAGAGAAASKAERQKQFSVFQLMSAYRVLGARKADLDPLKRMDQKEVPELTLAYHNLTDADRTQKFCADAGLDDSGAMKLNDIVNRMEQTYCRTLGVEFMHITRTEEREWLRNRVESELSTPKLSDEEKRSILRDLTNAETFERYLHTRYMGQKRFSLEGGESAIPGLRSMIAKAQKAGAQEVVIGMAHRGRLNVLVNVLGKRPSDLFAEFEGTGVQNLSSGDVKYHNGFTSQVQTPTGGIHVVVEFNPSHLEIVNPVVEGSCRARQENIGEGGKDKILPVLIHGDSALSGLGVNQATLNLSQARGFTTGGTVHLVINNQIGFTTSDSRDTRSSTYCSDIAKMIEAPIFHVNGDDPEMVTYAMGLAFEYRMRFHKDAFVDMVCYRRLGHNEADDPMLTQPMMYKKIKSHATTMALYAKKLEAEGLVSAERFKEMEQQYRDALDRGEQVEQSKIPSKTRDGSALWAKFKGASWTDKADTSLKEEDIRLLGARLVDYPETMDLHRTVKKVLEGRLKMSKGEENFDWGMAESLAYASLVAAGTPVRISGEDSGRGTFSHRHAVLHDQKREKWDQGAYIPLRHIDKDQANFLVIDSILNEEAVCAYEYGYASTEPNGLTIWEAQFGDFANGAQVAIDQFIAAGEAKWGRLCGLTLILPHGYDGQGAEHSSARVERWLQLSAQDNLQLVMMSRSAQMFHVLRRQILRPYRKPLVIFMSKRLLRFADSMSPISEFTEGSGFKLTYDDQIKRKDKSSVKRILLCAGQVYYDLAAGRKERGLEDKVAILRVEQLYPFPYDEVKKLLESYPKAEEVFWSQEEPRNQGAWHLIRARIEKVLGKKQKLYFSGREAAAAPAAGYKKLHEAQLKKLVADAFEGVGSGK